LVYKYGLYPAFEKAGISPDFVLKLCDFVQQMHVLSWHELDQTRDPNFRFGFLSSRKIFPKIPCHLRGKLRGIRIKKFAGWSAK